MHSIGGRLRAKEASTIKRALTATHTEHRVRHRKLLISKSFQFNQCVAISIFHHIRFKGTTLFCLLCFFSFNIIICNVNDDAYE